MRNNNRFKTLVFSLILSIIIYFGYNLCRDFYIIKSNENYKIKEYTYDQNLKEIKR